MKTKFAKFLIAYRQKEQLTQKEMAARLALPVVSYAFFENGTKIITRYTLRKISQETNTLIEALSPMVDICDASPALIGQKIGRLTCLKLEKAERRGADNRVRVYWLFQCECGKRTIAEADKVKRGHTASCGCWRRELPHKTFLVEKGTNLGLLKAKLSANNKSGYRGISWNKASKKWHAYINLKQKRINIGYFTDLQKAINARQQREEELFKPILDKYACEKTTAKFYEKV